jgi:2-keto-3-deoxy-L-rhamnonate aldolase RhmA
MSNHNKTRLLGMGTWLSIGSPIIAELASECGFDWLLVDTEHGCINESGILACLQAANRKGVKIIVRVGSLDEASMARILDWGASGIMLPHVTTVEQAERCVQAMRYPPYGKRGFSSSARTFKFGLDTPKNMSEYIAPLFLAQIENYEGVINSRDIAAVEGVDMLFVGPADLSLDLSCRTDEQQLQYDEALRIVNESARLSGKQTGILVRNPNKLKDLREVGFSCMAMGSDISYLREGFHSGLQHLNGLS